MEYTGIHTNLILSDDYPLPDERDQNKKDYVITQIIPALMIVRFPENRIVNKNPCLFPG
jgi:hypothetical protein